MWPFGGKRTGKTVAEREVANTSQIVRLASEIRRLQAKVVWLERNAPYEKNDRKRRQMDIHKIRLEQKIQSLERKHHALARKKG